jgi:protease I
MRRAACLVGMVLLFAGMTVHGAPRSFRIVMVIAPREFTDQEYFEPRKVFQEAGAAVVTCSTGRQAAVSHDGVKVLPDVSTPELRTEQFDAIVLVGGLGAASSLLKDEPLRKLLAAAKDQRKVIAAICMAPAVLAQAGVLRNVAATCYPDARTINSLKMMGASYVDRTVVVSGNIVTGNGPGGSKEFARRVLGAIEAP